eukprot:4256069-Pleurochrysis_carterae.AAC.2
MRIGWMDKCVLDESERNVRHFDLTARQAEDGVLACQDHVLVKVLRQTRRGMCAIRQRMCYSKE